MSHSIPVLSTNIAGIPEMVTDGVEGFLFAPYDDATALSAMKKITEHPGLCTQLGENGLINFKTRFDIEIMVESYQKLLLSVAPPLILIDMDGVIVDWDAGFYHAWQGRCDVHRDQSYFMVRTCFLLHVLSLEGNMLEADFIVKSIHNFYNLYSFLSIFLPIYICILILKEQCVNPEYKREAELLIHSQGFFESLPPMTGSIEALEEMRSAGFKVYICTSPVITSLYCAQEKINWVRSHLGETWIDKLILCYDKSNIKGGMSEA